MYVTQHEVLTRTECILAQNVTDISLHDNLYILGDFNLHLDNSNGNTNKFNEILTCFDLKQHVNFPTHVRGHWLDLLITKRISHCIKSVFFGSRYLGPSCGHIRN